LHVSYDAGFWKGRQLWHVGSRTEKKGAKSLAIFPTETESIGWAFFKVGVKTAEDS
jgi:hypothetical protein